MNKPKPFWHIRHAFTTDKDGVVLADIWKTGDHEFEFVVFGKGRGKTRHFEDAVCEANALLDASS